MAKRAGQQRLFNLGARPEVIRAIKNAARNQVTLIITYTKSNGETSVRETEPYEIKEGKYWGYCLNSQGIRQFNLERIVSAKVTKIQYSPRWPVKII